VTDVDIDALNRRFALANHVAFTSGPGDLGPVAEVANRHATATVALQGAHVIAFQPRQEAPVLWVSADSYYKPGKAIRGGMPVCWPWFADHPTDRDKPAHGLVRATPWIVLATEAAEDAATRIQFGIADDERTRALWPHRFDVQLVVTVGTALGVELVVHNPGDQTFLSSGALHSYFTISDIGQAAIHGLDGSTYIDKVDHGARKVQRGPVKIGAETDRVYLDTTAECVIEDPGMRRRIRVAKTGSRSTVVWNPWVAKAASLADFGDDEYPGMVCVETANAGDDVVPVAPSGTHRLQATISTEPLVSRSGNSLHKAARDFQSCRGATTTE
jgi:glucose-6-phosphate 1-epimerase